MLECVRVFAVAVTGGLLAASTIDRSHGALAASPCISEPNAQIAPGAHWYYHVDPVSRRKCWYLEKSPINDRQPSNPQPIQPVAAPPAAAPVEQPTAQSPFSSFFSQLSKLTSPGTPQSEPVGNSATPQPNPVAAPPTEEISARQRVSRPDLPKNAASRRPDRTAAATPSTSSRPPATITAEQRDALFQRYLRWQDDREKHDALFQRYLQWNEQEPHE